METQTLTIAEIETLDLATKILLEKNVIDCLNESLKNRRGTIWKICPHQFAIDMWWFLLDEKKKKDKTEKECAQ